MYFSFHFLWFYGFWVSVHCLDFKSQGVIIWLVNFRMARSRSTLIFVCLFVCLLGFCSLFLIENLSNREKIFLKTEENKCMFGTWKVENFWFLQMMFQASVWELQKQLSLTLIKNHKITNHRKIPLRSLNPNIFIYNLQDSVWGVFYVTASEHDLFLHFTSTIMSCTSKSE